MAEDVNPYRVHVVPEQVYDNAKIGSIFRGEVVVDGLAPVPVRPEQAQDFLLITRVTDVPERLVYGE